MRRRHVRHFSVAILALSLTSLAPTTARAEVERHDDDFGAEELLFEDIPSVFAASKYEQKITEAPARISIVTGDEIRRFGYRTFSEVLRSLPGFSVNNDRNYSYTAVRGFGIAGDYDTRLLQLVDGHRINDNLYGSLYSDHSFPVDMHMIDRVEVIRGPSSSLYGSGAFFAVVNVITKKGRDIGGWEVSAAAGSLQTKQAQLTFGERMQSGLEILISGTVSDSKGNEQLYYPEFDDPATNDGVAESVDGEEFQRFFARVSLGDFAIEGVYGEREKLVPTASFDTVFNTEDNRTWDSRGYLDLKYQTLFDNGTELIARLFYDSYSYKGDYLYDYGDPGDPYLSLNKDIANGKWWGTEFQWRRRLGIHHLVAGADYRSSFDEEQKNYDQDGVYLDVNTNSDEAALFVQDEITLTEDLMLNLGLRYDHYSIFGGTANPRAALIWSPLANTTFKLLYGEAFRAPNAYEFYYNGPEIGWKQNLGLEPETINTVELVLEQQLSHSLRGVFSIYRNEIHDLIALATDPADGLLNFVNQGDAEARGVELEVENRWQNGILATASYTHQDAEDATTGEQLVNYARHMLKFNMTAPLFKDRLGAALEAQFETGRLTIAGVRTDERALLNLSLFSERWLGGLTASATLYNLLNDRYSDPGSEEHAQDVIEQDGRSFRLRFDYAF